VEDENVRNVLKSDWRAARCSDALIGSVVLKSGHLVVGILICESEERTVALARFVRFPSVTGRKYKSSDGVHPDQDRMRIGDEVRFDFSVDCEDAPAMEPSSDLR